MPKRSVEIGDKFGTWGVIGYEENNKQYNYNFMCQCECGNKKVIRKDVLLAFKFAKCDRCLSMGLIKNKKDLILSRWDGIINGKIESFTKLDTNKQYYWTCSEGHSYRTSIILLNEQCPKCKALSERDYYLTEMYDNFDKLIYFVDQVTCDIFTSEEIQIEIEEVTRITRIVFKDYVILCTPVIHKQYNELVHENKSYFLEIQNIIKDLSEDHQDKEMIKIDLVMKFEKDKRTIMDLLRHLNSKYLAN